MRVLMMKERNKPFFKEKEISGHNGAIYSITSDNDFIYSASADRFVARWRIEEGIQDNFTVKLDHPVYSILLVRNMLFIGLNNGDLHIVDVDKRQEVKFYQQHKKGIFAISHNARKGHVYVGDADGNVSVWDEETLKLQIYLPMDCGKIRDISVSPNGDQFILGGQDGYCRILNAQNFNETKRWLAHKDGVTSVCFDHDLIVSGGKDALLKCWTLEGQQKGKSIPAHNYAIYSIIKLNAVRFISASRDKTVKVWDREFDFQQRLDFKEAGHRHSVNEVIKLDDCRFASCGDDARIIIWRQEVE